ncbi:MAG: hypothetical protein AAGN35_14735 [Bacteroidota bacterium]
MKKNLYISLGILGLTLIGYSLFQAWNGYTPKFGSLPPIINEGYTLWQGLVAGGMALVALVLIYLRNKLAVIPALLAVGMAVFAMLAPEKEGFEPMQGIYFAIAGGVVQAIGALLTPKKV